MDEAGIAADRIHLVFGGALVRELAGPEFARTRNEVLGLAYAPSHFKLVRARRGPDERRLDSAFIPSEEDYEAGRVHRPAAADQVLAHMDRHRCALVRGVGASGKSVLAWLLALEAAEQRHPAYLLDLADYLDASPDTASALIEDLHRFGHPEALFILDNCHLEESLAKEVVLAWHDLVSSQQPRLLLLGRELHTSRGSLIDGLRIEPLTLRARQPEVRGVYLRLARRHTGDRPPPEPPPEVLDQWVGTFGGDPRSPDTTTDLIAFSAAVRGRMNDLLNRRWTLGEADAIHEVRSVYLDPKKLSEGETRNLMRLCVMQDLDLSLDEGALADPRARFDRCSKRLGLVFRQTAGAAGQHVRYRLAHAALGRLILRAAYAPPDPAAERRDMALGSPHGGGAMLGRLVTLGRLPEARALATEMLARPECLLELGPLIYVHLFLRRVQGAGATLPVGLVPALIAQPARQRLVERALQTPLEHLASFLGYAARTAELKPVFAALAAELVRPENRQELAERALQTPLGHLAGFLAYAAGATRLKPVFAALAADLVQPDCRVGLTQSLEAAPLNDVVGILESEAARGLWDAVFAGVDAGRWDEVRRNEQSLNLDAFVAFQGTAAKRGRPELAMAPALRLVLASTREEWHQPGTALHHLSHVLRHARGASPAEVEGLLERVATPDWVDGLFESAPAGGLAGNLLALATRLSPAQHHRFRSEALARRVSRELSSYGKRDAEALAQAISLLGASRAIGLSGSVRKARWPDTRDLAAVLERRAPDPDRATIGPMQVQLWLGLREMACWRANPVPVSPELAERILDLWQATEQGEVAPDLPPHVRTLNAGMIAWLQRCSAAGWRLVQPGAESAPSTEQVET